jgi:hypothetical protein
MNKSTTSLHVKNYNWLIAIILLIIFLPPIIFANPSCNLDQSWRLAINMAINQNLIFGSEFVFTYGPLGYLATRESAYLSIFNYLFFDIYFIILVYRLTYFSLQYWPNYIKYIFIIFSLAFFSIWGGLFAEELQMLLFISIIFEIFNFSQFINKFSLPIIILNCLIGLYIKVNYALIFLISFIYIFIFLYLNKSISFKKLCLLLILYLILIVVSNNYLKVDFLNYVINSLYLIDGYNDTMYSLPDNTIFYWYMSFAAIAIGSLLIAGSYLFLDFIKSKEKKENLTPFLIFTLTSGLIFVLFKQTVVNGHIFAFPKVYLPLVCTSFLYINKPIFKKIFIGFLILSLFPITYYCVITHKYF